MSQQVVHLQISQTCTPVYPVKLTWDCLDGKKLYKGSIRTDGLFHKNNWLFVSHHHIFLYEGRFRRTPVGRFTPDRSDLQTTASLNRVSEEFGYVRVWRAKSQQVVHLQISQTCTKYSKSGDLVYFVQVCCFIRTTGSSYHDTTFSYMGGGFGGLPSADSLPIGLIYKQRHLSLKK